MKSIGVAFDLDGTLINNNHYHILSWQEFYKRRNKPVLTEIEFIKNFNGKTNADVLKYVFNHPLSTDEIINYTNEKEAIYRSMYQPYIQPVKGLISLLNELQEHNIPMVIATSGIPVNIEFMFQHIPIKQYFKTVINSTHIQSGKPHPEIYLKASAALGLKPQNCIAFEDAVAGVQSAHGAGNKVIALTTTHNKSELQLADLIITDFSEITVQHLLDLIE